MFIYGTNINALLYSHCVHSASLCLQIKLVNIRSTDIVNGKATPTLGLVWMLILHFQVIVCSCYNYMCSFVAVDHDDLNKL